MGDDVSVGAGDAVGAMAGSAEQPASMAIRKINAIWCFMKSPHWRIILNINIYGFQMGRITPPHFESIFDI